MFDHILLANILANPKYMEWGNNTSFTVNLPKLWKENNEQTLYSTILKISQKRYDLKSAFKKKKKLRELPNGGTKAIQAGKTM